MSDVKSDTCPHCGKPVPIKQIVVNRRKPMAIEDMNDSQMRSLLRRMKQGEEVVVECRIPLDPASN